MNGELKARLSRVSQRLQAVLPQDAQGTGIAAQQVVAVARDVLGEAHAIYEGLARDVPTAFKGAIRCRIFPPQELDTDLGPFMAVVTLPDLGPLAWLAVRPGPDCWFQLPTGRYDIFVGHRTTKRTHLFPWASSVIVTSGRIVDLTLRLGGLALEDDKTPSELAKDGTIQAADAEHAYLAELRSDSRSSVLSLVPGRYDLYWKADWEHEPMLWKTGIEVSRGQMARVALDSGIELDITTDPPITLGSQGWWAAVTAGDPATARVNWARGQGRVALPPGRYDVYWKQDWEHEPFRWMANAEVAAGKFQPLALDAGLTLEVATDPPVALGSQGWWGAVDAGSTPANRVNWANAPGTIALPAGKYDVYWKQDWEHEPMLWQADVEVGPAHVVRVAVDSGALLSATTDRSLALGSQGWWGASKTGEAATARVNWAASIGLLVLPRGRYDIYWKQDWEHQPVLLQADFEVTPGFVRPLGPDATLC